MIMLAIIFLLFFNRIKVKIKVHQENTEGFFILKVLFFKVKKKITIVTRKKSFIVPEKRNMNMNSAKSLAKIIKLIPIDSLDVKVRIGGPFDSYTLDSVIIVSLFLETLKVNHAKKIPCFSYQVLPIYGDRFLVGVDGEVRLKVSFFEMARFFLQEKLINNG